MNNAEGNRKMKNEKDMIHIGGVIDSVLKTFRCLPDGELTRIWEMWDGIVGEVIAGNARPEAFKGTLLLVSVTSSTWIHHLHFLKKDIIQKINQAFGKTVVEDIKFQIGSPVS